MKTTILRLAGSALVLASVTIGCKPPGQTRPAAISSVAPDSGRAGRLADKAAQALADRRYDRAIAQAELAVAAEPGAAPHRALLAQAYLGAGRFASAETSAGEALALDAGSSKAALTRALAEIALGKDEAARATLVAADGIGPADRGLAFALIGDLDRAIVLLEGAVRERGATPKTRQNLALTYGLAGDWNRALALASIDTPKGQLTERMTQWATLARPKASVERVAALLGVAPVLDPGRPTALALHVPTIVVPAIVVPAAAPVAVAAVAADPAPAIPSTAASVVMGPVVLAEAPLAPAALPVLEPTAPILLSMKTPPTPLPTPIARPSAPSTPLVVRAAARPAFAQIRAAMQSRLATGGHVVQLGAYSSPARVEAAWSRAVGRVAELGRYAPSSAAVAGQGGPMYRLALGGFATRAAAVDLCLMVRARGGACFVRPAAGEAPVRWASLHQRLASR